MLVVQLKVVVFPAITDEGENEAVATLGAATTARLAESVVPVVSTLAALMVQVPVPVALVDTVMLPEAPEPEPLAAPEQLTFTLLASAVDQENVLVPPTVTVAGENDLDVMVACV